MSRATLLWMFAVVVAASMLYAVKYRVQGLRSQVAEISRQFEQEKEALHVVAAEWAYLNRPERLKSLNDKYLGAGSLTVDRIAEIEAIPLRSTAANDAVEGVQPASARGMQ